MARPSDSQTVLPALVCGCHFYDTRTKEAAWPCSRDAKRRRPVWRPLQGSPEESGRGSRMQLCVEPLPFHSHCNYHTAFAYVTGAPVITREVKLARVEFSVVMVRVWFPEKTRQPWQSLHTSIWCQLNGQGHLVMVSAINSKMCFPLRNACYDHTLRAWLELGRGWGGWRGLLSPYMSATFLIRNQD